MAELCPPEQNACLGATTSVHHVVVRGAGHAFPARLASLLLPPDVEVVGMNFWRQPESHGWCAQLSVRVPSRQRLTLVIERCNRLIDVVEAVELADHDPRRQSVYVQMVTDATDWVRIVEIITSFGAEIVAARMDQVVLHLCGTPDHCAAFIWMLRSYDLLDCMASAVFAFPADASASGSAGSRPHVHAS